MSVKMVQSLVSVTCETMFLVPNNERSHGQAQALFGLNIAFGILTVLMDILVLCLRGSVLKEAENDRVEAAMKDVERLEDRCTQEGGTSINHASLINSLSPLGNGPRRAPSENKEVSISLAEVVEEDIEAEGVGATEMHDDHLRDHDGEQGQVEEKGKFKSVVSEEQDTIVEGNHQESNNDGTNIEITHIYEASSTDIINIQQNPMHGAEGVASNDRNITTVQAQNMELKVENANLQFEIKNVKNQNRMLHQRVQDLESQVRNHLMNDGNL